MPPRKSDPAARQSNTISAHFTLKDDVEPASSVPASSSATPRPAPTPVSAIPATPVAAPAVEMETDRPSDSVPPPDKERKESRDAVTIEDLTLPKSIITRLAKGVLPPNTQIQTNAVLAMSKSATVFINHLANAANEHTKGGGKKTIMPNDVFAALEDIEFPFLREALENEFKKFNEIQTTKRNTYRRKVAAAKAGKAPPDAAADTSTASATQDPDASTLSTATAGEAGAAPRSKKHKPNGPDDSQMDVDGAHPEERDASDPDSEHEEHGDDDEEDDGDEDENEDEEADDPHHDESMRDTIEEKDRGEERDEALDDGDSD